MARRKRSKQKKLEPAEMTLTFPIGTITPGDTMKTIDLSQCASIVNRRFYRQGLNWAVAGFSLHAVTGAGTIQISRLPQTWVTSGAWEKTMRIWLRQQNEAIDEAGMESAVARFRDFKVHMDKTHVDGTFANNFLPYVRDNPGTGWEQYLPGEWNNSLVVVPNQGGVSGNTQEYSLNMIGDDDAAPQQSKGVIKAYMESRAVPFSPDPETPPAAEDNLFTEMFDVGMNNEDIVDNAIDRNDNLPYAQMEYPGSELNANGLAFHDALSITATTVSGKTSCGGTTFPCGLIRLRIDSSLSQVGDEPIAWLQVHLVPGPHRGYMAESMVDM